MTYICCLCHGVFLVGMASTEATESRRAFAICMFRSGTIPSVVRSDQGPEFKNSIMEEYTAILGIGQKFGTPWRPMEQGLVEGKHKEVQKLFGILVMDVMKCFPDEVSELLPCIEYMIYNTPGPHGYTPRDIDRRWSMKTPLERELHGVQMSESEPMQEKIRQTFNVYGQVRTQVLELKRQQAMQRADLSNRRRVGKRVQEGDYVLVRDNRPHRTGGRTPWKSPMSEPALVLDVEGTKIKVRYRDGTEREVHAERVLQIPGGYEDFERLRLQSEDQGTAGPGDHLTPEPPTEGVVAPEPGRVGSRSPGQMIEDDGAAVRDHSREVAKVRRQSKGKLTDMVPGSSRLAYSVSSERRTMGVGLLRTLLAETSEVEIHVYGVTSDLRMTTKWRPLMYNAEGQPVFEEEEPIGGPVLERIEYSRILRPIGLSRYGVMRASDLRALDTQGWTPEVRVECGMSVLGKLTVLDPRPGMDRDGDDFGGRFNCFQNQGDIIGKVMGSLSAPGIDRILSEIRQPRNDVAIPEEAGAQWPGRDWTSRIPDLDLFLGQTHERQRP